MVTYNFFMDIQTTGKWKFIAGNVPLEFLNTAAGRVQQDEKNPLNYIILKDKLENFSDLTDWGKTIGILNDAASKEINLLAAKNEHAALKVLQHARVLRELIFRIIICLIEGYNPKEEDIDLFNKECTAAREHQKLIFETNKFTWKFDLKNPALETILWIVTLYASELLTSDMLPRVKQCPGNNCGWLFLDSSKNGRRQWCDMKDCGNLAKVHRFRGKQK